jgi:hypothetical protein
MNIMEIEEFKNALKQKIDHEIAWLGGERNSSPQIVGMKKAFSSINKWMDELSKLSQHDVIKNEVAVCDCGNLAVESFDPCCSIN